LAEGQPLESLAVTSQSNLAYLKLHPTPAKKNSLGASKRSMKDEKHEVVGSSPTQGATGTAKNAEKVRSSRYEWDNKSGENENPAPGTKAARGSLFGSLRT
jgi:hypothetical protein